MCGNDSKIQFQGVSAVKVKANYINNGTPIFVHRRPHYPTCRINIQEVYYHGQNRSLLITLLKYTDKSHTVIFHILNLLFNIIFPFASRSPVRCFPLQFPQLHKDSIHYTPCTAIPLLLQCTFQYGVFLQPHVAIYRQFTFAAPPKKIMNGTHKHIITCISNYK